MRTIYFENPNTFPEIDRFMYETASTYGLPLETIRADYKSSLEALLKEKLTKAIFLGTRNGDPNAVGQQEFSPSSPCWPSFMRVNPILGWSYSDVWSFLLTFKVLYCILYDQGYTSIGSIHNTVPNKLLRDGSGGYRPAYTLSDGNLERAGRAKKAGRKDSSVNGSNSNEPRQRSKL
ncbi:unnamed protein product [Miscanthus lutarioriparius]|uniref:FAD synthase n=1 Tax=Miscanthus lutarioriparius TaxID=422564 RepID=A0A811P4P3_9POAL|nr:unnamed protein product [Miscanthus lutarioriparius]